MRKAKPKLLVDVAGAPAPVGVGDNRACVVPPECLDELRRPTDHCDTRFEAHANELPVIPLCPPWFAKGCDGNQLTLVLKPKVN